MPRSRSPRRDADRASPPIHPSRRQNRSRSPRPSDRSEPSSSSYRNRDDSDRGGEKRREKTTGGFKFKDTSRRDDDRDDDDRRGYRDRARSPRRDYNRDDDRDNRDRLAAVTKTDAQREADQAAAEKEERRRRRKEKKAAAAAAGGPSAGEEMIIVSVNDRLGTKSQIPCFASDTIGNFKIMVAARIGREKHEIMLKRQGERPFKDHITLGDYGISNGVQIDLEMDTGD